MRSPSVLPALAPTAGDTSVPANVPATKIEYELDVVLDSAMPIPTTSDVPRIARDHMHAPLAEARFIRKSE
jgi:hypothetical protein